MNRFLEKEHHQPNYGFQRSFQLLCGELSVGGRSGMGTSIRRLFYYATKDDPGLVW